MQTDRTTKTLLFFISIALWGLLLRPLFTPIPSEAGGASGMNLVGIGGTKVYLKNGVLFSSTPGGHDRPVLIQTRQGR